MSKHRSRSLHNRLRRLTKGRLGEVMITDQEAFNRWHSQIKSSKYSQQQDLPSSQIPTKMSLVRADTAQLFVLIDTCTLCSYRVEFMEFVTRLRQIFPRNLCPIKFIMSIPVLQELDKCNRRTKKQQVRQNDDDARNNCANNATKLEDVISIVKQDLREPPRSFMRFVEEELRTSEILMGDMDPLKRTNFAEIGNFEIVNYDDRILECCLRSKLIVSSKNAHPDTKVLLVTEDNLFKSKATTFDIVSYRWTEFKHKYKNFGLNNYVSTPKISLTKKIKVQRKDHKEVLELKTPRLKSSISTPAPVTISIPDSPQADSDIEIIGEVIMLD